MRPRGTEGSNPVPSTGESAANSLSELPISNRIKISKRTVPSIVLRLAQQPRILHCNDRLCGDVLQER